MENSERYELRKSNSDKHYYRLDSKFHGNSRDIDIGI